MSESTYSRAMQKLETIIGRIESEEIDVDELSKCVKEAVELVRICKEKIEKAEAEVKKVVDDIDKEVKEK